MSDIFYRFSPFIQEYIYRNNWESLRGVQTASAQVLFETEHNLLLTSSTASGKTEAAFFPIISMLTEDPPQSVGVLYIAPLKSLINDQFLRLDEILKECDIPVFHWHGDVSSSHKNKLLKNPSGVLQITPESLESMLMNKHSDIIRLFGGLRYVIIDEIHTLMGVDRGNQILCQLDRIAEIIGHHPRRLGLSATIGDLAKAQEWLTGNSGRNTQTPTVPSNKHRVRLAVEQFYIQDNGQNREISTAEYPETAVMIDAGYEYIYDCVKDKKSLVFSNSREETEYITATLRQIADNRHEQDIFLIHHGNLSASLREEAEFKMKNDEYNAVTCATVTLELGVDIGRLERVVQNGSPNTVSSFLQRLGRSGRRGSPPEMFMVFREENPLPETPMPQLIPWELIRAIAIVQLYIEERFIEPPSEKRLPFSLLFQQTLSILFASGELTAKALAERVLSLPAFERVTKEEYKALLVSMLKCDYLQMTEEKTFLIGLAGERIVNSFKFYAVFKDSENFSVRCESDEIGTITTPPPVGDRFALAGRVWEVTELDIPRKLIYVKGVKGKMEVTWPGESGEIHTRVLERMRKVLCEDKIYPYLKPNARRRLDIARRVAQNAGVCKRFIIPLGGLTYCMFPWLGTRSFRTLRKLMAKNAKYLQISNIEYDGCCYLTFKYEGNSERELINKLCALTCDGFDKKELVSPAEVPIFEKYDEYIPHELLRSAYAEDRLREDEVVFRIGQMYDSLSTNI